MGILASLQQVPRVTVWPMLWAVRSCGCSEELGSMLLHYDLVKSSLGAARKVLGTGEVGCTHFEYIVLKLSM